MSAFDYGDPTYSRRPRWLPPRDPKAPEVFDPLAAAPGKLFGPHENAWIDLQPLGLTPGTYAGEFWDTWSTNAPERRAITVTATAPQLPLPPLVHDLAIKLKRVREPAGTSR